MAEIHGLGLTPYIVVSDARAALDFYTQAFGARETARHEAPHGGKIMHARMDILGSELMLSDDFPEFMGGRSRTPQALGGTPFTLALQVADAEAAWKQAVEAGATVEMPLKEQFWGEKYGKLVDPFGHEWSISELVKVMTPEEMEEGAKTAFK